MTQSINITVNYDTPTNEFRQLIIAYPTGTYVRSNDKDNGHNWFKLNIGEIELTWFSQEINRNLMDDWFRLDKDRKEPVVILYNYTPMKGMVEEE